MKTWRVVSVFIGLFFVAGTAWAGGDEEKEHGGAKAAIAKAKVPMMQAIETATKEVKNGKPYKAELEIERGQVMYGIDMVADGKAMEAEIDAVEGKVIKVESAEDEERAEKAEAGKKEGKENEEKEETEEEKDEEAKELAEAVKALDAAKITMIQAVEIAMKEVKGGKPYEAELEMEEGKPQYEVKVMADDKRLEVKIDAVSGKVLKVEKEEGEEGQAWTFDKDELGKTPGGLLIKQNNPTKELGRWTVEADPAAPSKPNVLSLKTQNGNATFNLAIVQKASFKDLALSVKIRGNSGSDDQGGGLIWRAKDENNYYICRINPLEPNYRVYKVVDGKRKQLQSAEVKTETGKWYTLKAVMVGDHIMCFLDGKKMLDVKDDTFKDAGMIGLWTKADASSSFDDLTVHAIREGGEREGKHEGHEEDGERKLEKGHDKDKHEGAKDKDDDDDDDDAGKAGEHKEKESK
jgi:uncharacterized membrane protein YkoI